MRERFNLIIVVALFVALLGAMAAKSLLIQIPPLRSASAAGEFNANRAFARLARILGDEQPHPADTVPADGVRDRLIAEIRGLGFEPIVRDQFACNELMKARGVSCARVRNVIVNVGPQSGPRLLLNAHYDSSSVGPGAADDGIGVATLLEVAAILKDRPLRRPVTFLFNEGEELGLVGARAFLADPISFGVDSLINLEARGVRGPANMFETSVPNGPAVKVFSAAVERPVANSLATDVYRLLPNYTDVNSFAERGWLTLNLAVIGNETRYHSPGDNLASLNRRSLQHMGDQTLSLARALDAGAPAASGSRMFMDVLGRQLLVLPSWLGLTILELLLLAFAWTAFRRQALGRGLAATGGALVAAALLAWLGEAAVAQVRPGMFWRAYPLWTVAAVNATALLAAVAALGILGKRLDLPQLRAAYWLLFAVLGTLLALIAPGGAIYFLIPPLLVFIGTIARRWWRPAERVAGIAAVALLYLTLGAMLGLLEELLNQGPMWLFAPLGVMILLPALIELRPLLGRARSAIAVAGAIALIAWAAVLGAPAYSLDRKQRLTVEYVCEPAQCHWAIASDGALPQSFGTGWERRKLPHSKADRWTRPAPRQPVLAPATIEVVGTATRGSDRLVRIRLRPAGAQTILLLAGEDSAIRSAGARGFVRPIDAAAGGDYAIRCTGRSCDGQLLDLLIARREPIAMTIVGIRTGLPPSGSALLQRRPATAQPQYLPDQTVTVAKARV